jgi:stearoyl-CoA desaturase (delta-9 desaturase)
MMRPVERIDGAGASSTSGQIKLDLTKSAWIGLMLTGSLAAPFFVSWSAVALFAITTYLTLLLGHSVGMHRLMIHRSFDTVPWLRRLLILIGTLVGMGGPSQIIRTHDMRDWAQRLPDCHDYFSHRRNYLRDVSWQLFYRFDFDAPPALTIESEVADDPFIRALDKSWWLLQLSLAAIFFAMGGLFWVLWGVCLRVFMSVAGHWSVTYICHNPGPGRWHVDGAGVQASNLKWAGFLTHGECWHNNHHAFPESPRIGLDPGQLDPAWAVIKMFERLGLTTRVGTPRAIEEREDLKVKETFS